MELARRLPLHVLHEHVVPHLRQKERATVAREIDAYGDYVVNNPGLWKECFGEEQSFESACRWGSMKLMDRMQVPPTATPGDGEAIVLGAVSSGVLDVVNRVLTAEKTLGIPELFRVNSYFWSVYRRDDISALVRQKAGEHLRKACPVLDAAIYTGNAYIVSRVIDVGFHWATIAAICHAAATSSESIVQLLHYRSVAVGEHVADALYAMPAETCTIGAVVGSFYTEPMQALDIGKNGRAAALAKTAARHGNVQWLERFYEFCGKRGISISTWELSACLRKAVKYGHLDTVKYLASLTCPAAIRIAAVEARLHHHRDVEQWLLDSIE